MPSYLTPEETTQQPKVEVPEILSLIEEGKLRAIRIGSNIRIPEPELERLPFTCAAGPAPAEDERDLPDVETPPENTRLVPTRTGRATFRVAGSVAAGAEIWPGRMRYPIKFPKSFMDALLAHFPAERSLWAAVSTGRGAGAWESSSSKSSTPMRGKRERRHR